jgi:hypothetical protein
MQKDFDGFQFRTQPRPDPVRDIVAGKRPDARHQCKRGADERMQVVVEVARCRDTVC